MTKVINGLGFSVNQTGRGIIARNLENLLIEAIIAKIREC